MNKKNDYVNFTDVELLNGFWKNRYDLNAKTSIYAVKNVFEKSGRFDAVRFVGDDSNLHVFFDSDVAKWIEAVAYLIGLNRNNFSDLELFCDDLIEKMVKNQHADGYFNSYFQRKAPDKIFTARNDHELYCAGHIIEAAIAYDKYVNKSALLGLAKRYVEFIRKIFLVEKSASYVTCGHEEIELALFKLYEYTGECKYKELAEFFINQRGNNELDKQLLTPSYSLIGAQDNLPARDLEKAEGHAVRAVYYYSAMADAARLANDESLYKACCKLYEDITERKLYVTGGIGSTRICESFTVAYDLPNLTAYTESCAAIGLIFFAQRMNLIKIDGKYGDLIERILYNGFLSSTSLDGKSFFYENPLEICRKEKDKETAAVQSFRTVLPIWKRKEVFDCSCCPPNINRFVASIGSLIYTKTDSGIYVNQYISSKMVNGLVTVKTDYPNNNIICITSENYSYESIFVRIPQWCNGYSVKVNGEIVSTEIKDGYAKINVGKKFVIELTLDYEPKFIESNPCVRENSGKVCLMNGPVVYCLEEIDNGADLFALSVHKDETNFTVDYSSEYGMNVYSCVGVRKLPNKSNSLYASSYPEKQVVLKFIPYYCFANREDSDMLVWVDKI